MDVMTLLFTDIVQSTKKWEEDPETMSAALRQHDELLHEVIHTCGGIVFKGTGDGVCAAFDTALNAIHAALVAQQELSVLSWERSVPASDEFRLKVRMSLYSGTPEARNGDYFGPPLNRAARLLKCAAGGEIIVPGLVLDTLPDEERSRFEVEDRGVHRLSGVVEPHRIFCLTTPPRQVRPETRESGRFATLRRNLFSPSRERALAVPA